MSVFKLISRSVVALFVIAAVACASAVSEPKIANAESSVDLSATLEHAAVRKALSFLEQERERNNKELIELNEIPAPPFEESERAARLAEMLREAGLDDVVTDSVGNVIGTRPGSNPERIIALAAHIDTVFPMETDVRVRREGDTFIAPGIGDNTRGLIALLSILRAFEHADIQTEATILFMGSVGEEGLGDLRGVRHLLRSDGPKIENFIAIDGGSTGRIVHRAVGSTRYKVSVLGPGGHSWGAFGAANPHHALGRAIANFAERAVEVTSQGEKSSFSIGRIGGGTSINSIASESWFEVDMRSGQQEKIDALDKILKLSVNDALAAENKARKRGPELSVDFKSVGQRPAGQTPASEELVQTALAATQAVGVDGRLTQSSTDANIPMSMGIPAITISRGGITKKAHSPDETWQDKDSHKALQSGFLIMLHMAGFAQ